MDNNDHDAIVREYKRGIGKHLLQALEYCEALQKEQPLADEELQLLALLCHHTQRYQRAADVVAQLRAVNPAAAASVEALMGGKPASSGGTAQGKAGGGTSQSAAVGGARQSATGGALGVLQMDLCGQSVEFVWVEGGTFIMGNDGGMSDERPAHNVELDGFYMARTQVTLPLWGAVMEGMTASRSWRYVLEALTGAKANAAHSESIPVVRVGWDDCQRFVRTLSQRTGRRFSLPTEAQWEYAARGGQHSRGYRYSGSNDVDAVAWHAGNSGGVVHPVATKAPNELGLYDMSGNVFEWCQDSYDSCYYAASPLRNPLNDSQMSQHVFRGGSCHNNATYCATTVRNGGYANSGRYNIGVRLVMLP